MTKTDIIQDLYNQVKGKSKFMLQFSASIGRTYNTLKNHWFGNGWQIPEDKKDETITYLENYLAQQNKQIN